MNFSATCGEVARGNVKYLLGCGYAALGTPKKYNEQNRLVNSLVLFQADHGSRRTGVACV
jgi:hypothetical protein